MNFMVITHNAIKNILKIPVIKRNMSACLENNCVEWLATPEAASVKTKYDNYIGYAKLYLFTTCKPPHPSASIQRVEGLVTNSSSQI